MLNVTSLKNWMQSNGKSGRWMAGQVGCDEGVIRRLLHGRRQPTMRVLTRLCQVTGLPVQQLVAVPPVAVVQNDWNEDGIPLNEASSAIPTLPAPPPTKTHEPTSPASPRSEWKPPKALAEMMARNGSVKDTDDDFPF